MKKNQIVHKATPTRKARPGELITPIKEGQQRMDGWQNLVTLLGTGADKRTGARIQWDHHTPEFYEQLYSGGGIPARIVDLVPEECMRNGWDWLNKTPEQKKGMNDRCKQLDLRGNFLKAAKWGRAYGGGLLHIVTDTTDPSAPLEEGEKVLALRDLSRWDVRILTTDVEYDFGSPNFGYPRIYYLNVQMGSQYKGYPIHWTRMIRFDGQLVPRRTFIRNGYWHDSILNRLFNSIRNYETSNDSAATALQDFNVDVYKLQNVAAMIGAGKEAKVRDRIEMMAYTKSVINAMILDTKDEEYENKGRSLEGVAELLVHQGNRLVAETDIPHTKLLGESPGGSNATGNSTSQEWYNVLGSFQENEYRPKLERLFQIIFAGEKDLEFKFKPVRVLDDKETADLRKTNAETDQIYLQAGVLDPSEVTNSRFGGAEYSAETKLDVEAREAGIISAGSALGGKDDEEGDDSGDGSGDGGSDEGDQGGEPDDKPSSGDGDSKPGTDSGKRGKAGKSNDGKSAPASSNGKKVGGKDAGGGESGRGKGSEGAPSDDTEKGNKQRPGGKRADLTGRKREALDSEGAEEVSVTSENPGMGQSEFEPRNSVLENKGSVDKTKPFISQTMSEPFRDPKTDPNMKGPGIPNKARTFLPTRGNGITAKSGFDFEKDAGSHGEAREITQVEPKRTEDATPGKTPRKDTDDPVRAATVIVRRGDQFLMGQRRDNGRWSLPGGHIGERESHHQGACRELMEETGLEAKKLKFLGGRVVEPKQGLSVYLNIYEHHAPEGARPTGRIDPDKEFGKFRWLSTTAPLPEDVLGNLQHPNNVALDMMGLLK